MERVDRRAFLRRASGVAVALSGWCRVSDAGGAADPRLVALQRLVKGPVIVRTSPSHGTAFDIAWKGTASPDGMIEAIRTAAVLAGKKGHVRAAI